MSGKTLFPTEGAPPGISAGAPFVVNEFTYVEQVTPPFLATSRLGRIADTNQSIIAPGANNSAHSTVLGEGAADSVGTSSSVGGGPQSVVIGYQVTQSPDSAPGGLAGLQVLIGSQINMAGLPAGNSQGLVAIGSTPAFTTFAAASSFGGSVLIGYTAKLTCINAAGGDATNAIAIGFGAQAIGQAGIAIGPNAMAANDAVAIGDAATALGAGSFPQAIAIGARASAQQIGALAIGYIARGGQNSINIGQSSDGTGASSSIAIGRDSSVNGLTNAIAIGREVSPGTNGMALFGSVNYPITALRFGGGVNNSTGAIVYTFGTTDVFGGAGNNVAGNSLVVQAGHGTGNWTNTQNLGLDLQVGKAQASGSTIQAYTSVLGIRHSDLNVSLWGGLGAPFSAGVGVMFIANAVTNPTAAAVAGGGILSVQGGNLHFLNAAGVDTALTPGGGGGGITGGGTTGTIPVFTGATAIGNAAMTVSGSNFQPTVDHGLTLGGLTNRWGGLYLNGTPFGLTYDNASFGTGAKLNTLTNGPNSTAGNPTKWLFVMCDGAGGVIPWWPI